MDKNKIRNVNIIKVIQETPSIRTIYFFDKECSKAKPGQFVMVWIPGIDELPMSLSQIQKDGYSSITIKPWQEGSKALYDLEMAENIGIRGPYGNGFKLIDGSALLIGGGTGLAPMIPLSQKLIENKTKIKLVMGARTKTELVFLERAEKIIPKKNIITVTDDGSVGIKGQTPDVVSKILDQEDINCVYVCGPKPMIKKIFEITQLKNTLIQASLETKVNCSVGICGRCNIGEYLLCIDGPVFDRRMIQNSLK